MTMNIRTLIAVTFVFIVEMSFSFALVADHYPKNPAIDIRHYIFDLTLTDESDEIRGIATITVLFKEDGISRLRLDFVKRSDALEGKGMAVESVHEGGQQVKFNHTGEELLISLASGSTAGEERKFTIRYYGVPATGLQIGPNKYDDRTFFSDNWPNRARNWLPTVDHPYDKATCEFIVTAPVHYQVVSNGLKLEETVLDALTRRTHWKQSVPISPWLYALAVAPFAVQYVDYFDGKSIQTWVYRQDRDAGFYDFAEPTRHVLEFYSDYVGPFVYEKLANIQSNSVGGGMEAASAIFYGDRSVTGERSVRWRNVVIHEIAHQWFGNAVTEYDWDDVWLSEGFATYFTLLFIEHAYGREEFVDGLKSARDRVYAYYKEYPDYRIVHDNLADMRQVTSRQTYQKGAWTLHMLRAQVGDEAYWRGIQSYYSRYMNGNASTADFRHEMESASNMNLEAFFQQWLYQGGHVILEGSWTYNSEGKTLDVLLKQVQDDGYTFKVPVEIGVYSSGRETPAIEVVNLDSLEQRLTIEIDEKPERVVLDPRTVLLAEWTFEKK